MNRTGITALLGAGAIAAGLFMPQVAFASTAQEALTSSSRQSDELSRVSVLKGSDTRHHNPVPRELGGIFWCPEGSTPSPFDMPIYDEEGLFVVGYETVWFCIPDDFEPQG